MKKCDNCSGSGKIPTTWQNDDYNTEERQYTCINCNGTGSAPANNIVWIIGIILLVAALIWGML